MCLENEIRFAVWVFSAGWGQRLFQGFSLDGVRPGHSRICRRAKIQPNRTSYSDLIN